MLNIEVIDKPKTELVSEWRDHESGARFLIAGVGRPAYQKARELAQVRLERELSGNVEITDETTPFSGHLLTATGKYLLLDWEGISTKDGEFKYSQDNAAKLLNQTAAGLTLWYWIEQQAEEIQKQADESTGELVGKSLNSTATKHLPKSGVKKNSKPSTKP